MQSLSINTAKIDKDALCQGKTGKFLNLTLMENRDGPDQYGNDGFIVQDIGKERRQAGEKGPIIGNWKHIHLTGDRRGGQQSQAPAMAPQRDNGGSQPDDCDDIPFSPILTPFQP